MPIIVEGRKDLKALALLGITKNVITLSMGLSMVAFTEAISRRFKKAVILTDWDRKGGQLARMLKDGLMTNGVQVNDNFRTQLVILSKKEAKDIEGLPRFVERLHKLAGTETRRITQARLRH